MQEQLLNFDVFTNCPYGNSQKGSVFCLEGVILIVVFVEIQGLGLWRNSLTGVIFEFPAGLLSVYHTLFYTQYLLTVDDGAVGAIRTGVLDLFAEQHNMNSFRHVFLIIHPVNGNCYCYFFVNGDKTTKAILRSP